MLLHISFPLKNSCNRCFTLGILEEPPTRTTSFTLLLSILATARQLLTVSIHFSKRSMFSCSNLARVIDEQKSIPSHIASTSIVVSVWYESVLFALSQAVLNFLKAFEFPLMSTLFFLLNSFTK
ncbi:heat shock 70 kDa protein [Trifolium repens]|nr:heat shock 70 kDa protein [Trifolium repens]